MKKRVIFVDDDPNVLKGLKRMLRVMRKEWEMEFVQSAGEALDLMDRAAADAPFDIVVSDIKMPGMDGTALLSEVKKRHPRMVRIVLSGESSLDVIMRSTQVSHQFLSKPCDADTLKATVARTCALQDLLSDETLKQSLAQMDTLPSMPSLYAEIIAELNSPDASVKAIGEIISKDVGMSAKMLQLVNSAYFGLKRHISSPAQAVSLLGIDTVKSLVLSIQIFSQFDGKGVPPDFMERLWEHNMQVGTLAKVVGKSEKMDRMVVDHAFMSGILHDAGKLMLAANFPERYREVLDLMAAEGLPSWRAEGRVLGFTHQEAGAYLMGLWGLPGPIVEAIAFHHRPNELEGEAFTPLTAVHIANAAANAEYMNGADSASSEPDMDYLSKLNLTERLPEWRAACQEAIQEKENADE